MQKSEQKTVRAPINIRDKISGRNVSALTESSTLKYESKSISEFFKIFFSKLTERLLQELPTSESISKRNTLLPPICKICKNVHGKAMDFFNKKITFATDVNQFPDKSLLNFFLP